MSCKRKNKVIKKQQKALNIARKDFDIKECENSRFLLVCNRGLMTGASRETLMDRFEPFGSIEKIILIPGKSFAFLAFFDESSAKSALDAVNDSDADNEIILLFINDVPGNLTESWRDGLPPGSNLLHNFLSVHEQESVLELFLNHFSQVEEKEILKNRQVKHYGYEFNYETNDIDADRPIEEDIPTECQPLIDRLLSDNFIPEAPDQLTANFYQPGQGIPAHVDSHACCTDWLCSISLGSGILMDFQSPKSQSTQIWLPNGSALILKEDSRYVWKHGISPRHSDIVPKYVLQKCSLENQSKNNSDPLRDTNCDNFNLKYETGLTLVKRGVRLSLTFRKATNSVCECIYEEYCNDPKRRKSSDFPEETASQIERKMVHMVYEEIASHFSETRHKPWPQVVDFIQTVPEHGVLLDVGCGNGKYLDTRQDLVKLGTDVSLNLLKIIADRGFQGLRCDMLKLGVRDNIADGVICVAALHHLSTQTRRVQAIQEMRRVLRPGGKLLIYVWAKDQKKENKMSSYLKQNRNNLKKDKKEGQDISGEEMNEETAEFGIHVHKNRTNFHHQDVLVPWKLKSNDMKNDPKTFKRFYHVFEEGEIETLTEMGGFSSVLKSYYDQGNWCIIVEK